MYSMSDLSVEIEQIVEGLEHMNAPRLDRDWITQQVMSQHADIDGEDADFYCCVSREKVRDVVRKRINRYSAKAEVKADPQLVLTGFERLQRYYSFEDGDHQFAVRVEDMTDAQLAAKERELMAMGAGCYQHADEIRRFRSQRRVAA